MNQHIKHPQKYQQFYRFKRHHRTEPVEPEKPEEDERGLQAKHYLMNLNKEIEIQYHPFIEKKKVKMDHSVSEWNHQDMKAVNFKMHENRNHSQNRQSTQQTKVKPILQALTTFEQELVQCAEGRKGKFRERSNWSETTRKQPKKYLKSNTVEIQVENTLNSIQVGFQKTPPKAIYVRQFELYNSNKKKSSKKDTLGPGYPKESYSITDRQSQERQLTERLPRLERMVPDQFKNKYKSIFRQTPSIKYSLPLQSQIGREITKINQLIQEEDIKLVRFQKI